MISALLLAAAVAGQSADEPVAKTVNPPPVVAKPAKKAPRKVQDKAVSQEQSVVNARRARRAVSNQQRARGEARAKVEYQRQMIAQEKAIKEYQEYVVKMGPIWAAEHANQIQQERNALIARQTQIMKQKADNQAWLLWQLQSQRGR